MTYRTWHRSAGTSGPRELEVGRKIVRMNWLERRIRRYEHKRWTHDDNRRVQPFAWGLEHIGGRADESDPAGFLGRYAREAVERSKEWYATTPATDYRL